MNRSKYDAHGVLKAEDELSSPNVLDLPLPNRKDKRRGEHARRADETRYTQASLTKRVRDRKRRANSA